MSPVRKLLFVALGALALQGVQACATDTELNPQPLPPRGENNGDRGGAPSSDSEDSQAGGSSGGFGTGSPSADAGAPDADAGDAGKGEGG